MKIFILLVFIFILGACSKTKNAIEDPLIENVQNNERLENNNKLKLIYRFKEISRVYKRQNKNTENESYCRLKYPVFIGSKNADKINEIIESFIADSTGIRIADNKRKIKSLELLADDFIVEYGSQCPYKFNVDSSVLLNKPNLLTLCISDFRYTGGAHEVFYNHYLVFNPEIGRQLNLNDIFVSGFESHLNKLIDAKYRKIYGITKYEKLDDDHRLYNNYIHFNNNFGLTNTGIIFHYNIYEIAAFSNGQTTISFPFSELSNILKPKYKLFINKAIAQDQMYKECIEGYINAEDRKSFLAIKAYISPKIKRFWDLINPTEDELLSKYNDSWENTSYQNNTIIKIRKVSEKAYLAYTNYNSLNKQTDKYFKKKSVVRFEFDTDERISSIYGIK